MVAESARTELNKLREELAQSLVSAEDMKNQITDFKKSEAPAPQLVAETLMQLEIAKRTVEAHRCCVCKAKKAQDAVESELQHARARVGYLEETASELQSEITCKENQHKGDDLEVEVGRLRHALEASEARRNEEVKNAMDMVERIRGESGRREAELEAELRKSSYEMEEMKAELMDKETELQGLCDENDTLLLQLENKHELEKDLRKDLESAKARLENAAEENRALNDALEKAREREREALMKVGDMREGIQKSERKVVRVTEQLEVAQAEMEGELRRLKVQADQWRKAAEVAAAMLSVGSDGRLVGRTSSMDHYYDRYEEEFEDDLVKKKNVKMLRRFGVLWKKPLK